MNIGLASVNVGGLDGAGMATRARVAEDVGVESFWTFEHVMVPNHYASVYPYSRSGKMPVLPETPFVDPLITLAHLAGVTSTLKLATGVNIMPQANPLLLAKQVASLDHLSGGRLILGLGAGWLEEEYGAMGVPFEKRGARFNDYLVAVKKVWSGETVEHQSEFLNWSGFKSYPLPVQKPHPPLIIGGTSPAALRRVVRHGDGWFAPSRNLEELSEMCGALREVASREGRDYQSLQISAMWGGVQEGLESIPAYKELGVTRLILGMHHLEGSDPLKGLESLGHRVIEPLKASQG
ncbi:MAG: LLM class F420-dependent oxidoreductase [Myxococcota bacterium]|nr:LLM class F420-dependent oxidoreductase [Myxococcota bacterium]